MSFAAVVSIVAAAIEIVMAALAFVLADAPGWRHLKTFAFVAASASAYSAINVLFSLDGVPAPVIVWGLRFNYLAACAHCAAWIVYCRVQYADALRSRDRYTVSALAALALSGLIPNLLTTDRIEIQPVAWAGVTYRIPLPTALGSVLMTAVPIVLIVPLTRYFQKMREKVPGARAHFVAFCFFFVLAVNEGLVTAGIVENLYLADLGFLVAVLSVLSEMAHRVAADANWLLTLSSDLSRQVDERTRELVEAREGLQRAERLGALGRLSASVGHEINNPLSYVLGNLDFAISELKRRTAPAEVREALDDARGGAERIRRIVKELRVFGRGSAEVQCELINPCDALESALRLSGNEIRCRASLVRDLEPLPAVLADPNRLTQVFVNLLLNAAQSIPEAHRGLARSVITLRSRHLRDDFVAIEVTDTGIGISDADQRRLFEPFFTTKPLDQGTGLGLFVSLGIITGFKGKIEIESRLGAGTTVRVVLPVATNDMRPDPITVPPQSVTRERRLLVVDDDVLVARTIVRLLKEHHVEVATSGEAGLRRLRESGSTFDLVLCDLMMPDMTGMELFEEIERSEPALAERFVFISGGGVTERSRKFIESHRSRVLSKPIDERAISQVLAQYGGQVSGSTAVAENDLLNAS